MGGFKKNNKIMCLHPVSIINPSKYVSLKYRDRFILQVPCNECAECQSLNSRVWQFRTYYEFLRCAEDSPSNFCYFDTLTYSEDTLPHLDELCDEFPHIPCFRASDVTKFFKRLRINLDRKFGDVEVRYFLSSEYGSLHLRPHYHLLLFVYGNIDPVVLSHLVAQSWHLGRTDGVPFKSSGYVRMHNVIELNSTSTILRCSNYVTKYVQKDCIFQELLNTRIKQCELILSSSTIPFLKSNSVAAKRLRTKLKSEVNQFHLQSLHFGELALRDMDLNALSTDNYLIMPSLDSVKVKIPISMYYKRKLFYEQYVLHGMRAWQLNTDGLKYKDAVALSLQKLVSQRFQCISLRAGLIVDCVALADYVLNKRGRLIADADPSTDVQQRLRNISYYNYVTQSDKLSIGIGLSLDYLGNSKEGYIALVDFVPLRKFITDNVFFDQHFEDVLKMLYSSCSDLNASKEEYYRIHQRLNALFKSLI